MKAPLKRWGFLFVRPKADADLISQADSDAASRPVLEAVLAIGTTNPVLIWFLYST